MSTSIELAFEYLRVPADQREALEALGWQYAGGHEHGGGWDALMVRPVDACPPSNPAPGDR